MKLTTHFLKQLIREAIDEAHCSKRDDDLKREAHCNKRDDDLKREEKGDEEEKELTPKQKKKLDVAPRKGEINAADFEKLRAKAKEK